MSISLEVPGRGPLQLAYLVLDLNGTLSDRGVLIEGVRERLSQLETRLEVRVLSADTFGTLAALTEQLGARVDRVHSGLEKRHVVERLGADRCAAIGNGANDVGMLEVAALGIVVVGREGAAGATVGTADIVCCSILDALDLLLDEQALAATLRT